MINARRADRSDLAALIATTVEAFRPDPAWAYLIPSDYDSMAPLFAEAIIGECLSVGEVWTVNDGQAVAAWLGPTPRTDSGAWANYLQTASPLAIERIENWDAAVGGLRPTSDHWYLDVLAVHPLMQGKGFARAVLAPILQRCDTAGLSANLETSTPANLGLYARFGFGSAQEINITDGPPVWFLHREPHSEN
jgi:GNAT superfamily N-acetyltransferase